MTTKIFDLTGKVALITGASSGLGRHFSKTLSEAGATVILSARRVDNLIELQNELKGNSHVFSLDVTSKEKICDLPFNSFCNSTKLSILLALNITVAPASDRVLEK